ncbi:MAG TPA: DNA polymerase/3'-5' exonuclease PolX [Chloroflexota bacterium]|nr:DNA polymerase/3'-5' exonuclease PolX [Chloroflexota bacterium]
MSRQNEAVGDLLANIAKLLALKGENPFRIRAYGEAARTISALAEDIAAVHHAGRLEDIPGVGEGIAGKVAEYLNTGRCSYYEQLKRQVAPAAADLLDVPSIGPVRAKLLYDRLGIASIEALQQAAAAHRLRDLPRFGAKLEDRIAQEAARVAARTRRLLLGVALPTAEEVAQALGRSPAVRAVQPAGSIRRGKDTIGDIDLLAAADAPRAAMDAFTALPIVKEVLAQGPTRASILTQDDLQVDLRVIPPDEYGAALQYFTGSKDHNIALRTLAMARGYKLSEYGLFDASGRRIAGRTEDEIYGALEMDWIPPELRENRGELAAAQQHRLPTLVAEADLRGDLHVHTDWSDGHDSPEQMVEAAIARGYAYLALTDHSRSLAVAHGLTVERVREQRHLIDRLNACYAPFRVLRGTEVDILPDGSLDYPDAVLAELDIVTASVHSAFQQPRERLTARLLRALRNPYVDVLNHPTGRLLPRRPEYDVDLEAVLRAAAAAGVALEVNGQPDRLDLDDVWARRAGQLGALLACDSDAHAARQLGYVRYAILTARRGWASPQGVLNTLPLDRLLAHLARRRVGARVA